MSEKETLNSVMKQNVRGVVFLAFVLASLFSWSMSEQSEEGFGNLIAYDKQEYLLAYNVFALNDKVTMAYTIAHSAVKQRPDSIMWRKKLIKAARASGHPKIVLDQWMYFIDNNINPGRYIEKALRLAGQISDYDSQAIIILHQLQHDSQNKSLVMQYSDVLQNQGYPNKALTFLQQIPQVENDPQYLEKLVSITKGIGDDAMYTHYLDRLWQLDKQNKSVALALAERLYSKGNLAGAFLIYDNVAKSVSNNNPKFWKDYIKISLLAGETAEAIEGYKELLKENTIDSPSFMRLIKMEENSGQKEIAYDHAKLAYQKYKDPQLIPMILSLGASLEKWEEMKNFLNQIPKAALTKLQSNPVYAKLIICINLHERVTDEIHKLWVFQRWPSMRSAKQSNFWSLDEDTLRKFGTSLNDWQKVLRKAAGLAVVHTLAAPNQQAQYPAALTDKMLEKIKKMPYNNETFKLAFQISVYNSRINEAYQLALIAVSKQPNDLQWHENLAQTATWVGDYGIGMKEWLYVVKHTKNNDTIKHVITIAKILRYDDILAYTLKIYLDRYPDDMPMRLELAQTQNRIGQPEQALLILQKINATNPTRASYELSATIYQDMAQWDNALNTWQYIDKHFGSDTKSASAEALIYYSRGQFKDAVQALKQGIASAQKKDKDFWQTLGDLAWIINDRPLITLGYSHNLKDSSNLIRIIEVEQLTNPQQALYYSLIGWKNFSQPLFFSSTLYLAQRLKQWTFINNLLTHLSDKQLKIAEKNSDFWEAKANLYAVFGKKDLQRTLLIQGILLHPEMPQLKSNLLWLLINDGDYQWVKKLLQAWPAKMLNNEVVWHAYAEGLTVLNQLDGAISVYQQHLPNSWQDDQMLIDYANLLEKAKFYQYAYNIRRYIWQRALLTVNQQSHLDKNKLRTIAQLAQYFVSGTTQVQIFNALLQSHSNEEDNNIVLNWLASRADVDPLSFFKMYYLNNKLPEWAAINLALAKNDLPALQNIITKPTTGSRADRINAAVRLENIPLALNLAFDELTERPFAHEIHSEFIQYALSEANYVNVAEEYEKFVNLAGSRTRLEGKLRLTNSLKMKPDVSLWTPKTTQPASITNVPNYDFHAGIMLDQTIHRGNLAYRFGYRRALSDVAPLSIDLNYRLAPKWIANVKLGYDQEDFQNAYLRIGGVQDQINLRLVYNMTQRDSFSAEGQGLNYYSQDRHYLANGYNLLGLYEHRLWLSYPNYTVGVFGNVYHFNRNGSYGGNVTTLFPALTPGQQLDPALVMSTNAANYQQLIPPNYNEGGLIFNFGDAIQEYSHRWRPYLWASLYYNSITRLSNDVQGGINGMVFGRDSLLIYAERGSAPTAVAQVNYMIGARYRLYF